MGDPSHEPSMEEILASIKRIIAEDGEGAPAGRRRGQRAAAAPPEPTETEDDGVLELTQRLDEPARPRANPGERVAAVEPSPMPGPAGSDRPPASPPPEAQADAAPRTPDPIELAVAADADAASTPRPFEDEEMMVDSSAEASFSPDVAGHSNGSDAAADEPLVSGAALAASRQAIAQLSQMVVKPDPGGPGTLEGLVREMLRPMLKDWLDARLPELVEQAVRREIARIVEDR